jgi:hydroxyacylglutathione hydrolase
VSVTSDLSRTSQPAQPPGAIDRLMRPLRAGPPRAVAADVWVVRGGLVRGYNAYLIRHEGEITLFDTGIRPMACGLARAIDRLGTLREIILSHAHGDHRGSAGALGAPVACHADEAADVEGDGGARFMRYAELPSALRRAGMARQGRWNDGGPVAVARTVGEGEQVAGFEVMECPGHSPGHIALWRAGDRVLLAGDAFMAFDLLWQRPRTPTLGPRAFIRDEAAARASLLKLAELGPANALSGHGPPVTARAAESLREAARAPALG